MKVKEFKERYGDKPIVFYNEKHESVCGCEVLTPVINPAEDLEVVRFGASKDGTKMLCYLKI